MKKKKSKKQAKNEKSPLSPKERRRAMRRAQTGLAREYLVSAGIPAASMEPLPPKAVRLLGIGLRTELEVMQIQGSSQRDIVRTKAEVVTAAMSVLADMKRNGMFGLQALGFGILRAHAPSAAGKAVLDGLAKALDQ